MDSLGSQGHYNTGKAADGALMPVNICSSDFSPALGHVGDLVTTRTLLSWCLPYTVADTNPLTADLDPDCVVIGSNTGTLPRCTPGTAEACYDIEPGNGCTHLLRVENILPADVGDQVFAVCQAK
jgi:hypothetical protein